MGKKERVPPHNNEAEMAVLGSVLLEPKALPPVMGMLRAEDFYRPDHCLLFAAYLALGGASKPIDAVTVREQLRSDGQARVADNVEFFSALAGQVPSVANAKHYAEIVAAYARLRSLATLGMEFSDAAFDGGPDDAQPLVDEALRRVLGLQQRRASGKPVSIRGVVHEVVTGLLDGDKARQWGMPTGWAALDQMTMGLHDGELAIVAGQPSSGKTTLALNIIHHLLVEGSELVRPCPGVLMFSLEMSREQLCQNLLCRAAGVSSHQLRRGMLDKAEWKRVRDAANRIYKAPLYLDDTPGLNIDELRGKAMAHVAEFPVGLIVVDYLQLATATVGKNATKEGELEAISHGLKNLARELKVPVLALSQLNRPQQPGSRPTLSRLRGSGAIEQDADLVLFLHNEAGEESNWDYGKDEGLAVDLIVGKQRNGPRGSVPMRFFPHEFRFSEPTPRLPDADDED